MVAGAAHASAAEGRSLRLDYRASGELRVTWTAGAGERGSVTLPVSTRGDMTVGLDGAGAGSGSGGWRAVGGDPSLVRVQRGGETCVEPAAGLFSEIGFEEAGRHQLELAVTDFDEELPAISSGRCAGPLPQDLRPLQPIGRLDLRRIRRRPVTVRLRASRPFAAGAVSGRFVSTVVVRFRRARVERDDDGDSLVVSRRARPAAATRFFAARLSGALTTSFAGGEDPACRLLDACALEGTSTLRFGGRAIDLERADDPREGDSLTVRATIDGRVRRPGAPDCVDRAVTAAEVELAVVRRPGGAERFELRERGPDDSGVADLLRTRCAGPAGVDLGGRILAAGDLAPGDDGEGPVTVRLQAARDLRGSPFAGGQRGELVLTLGESPGAVAAP